MTDKLKAAMNALEVNPSVETLGEVLLLCRDMIFSTDDPIKIDVRDIYANYSYDKWLSDMSSDDRENVRYVALSTFRYTLRFPFTAPLFESAAEIADIDVTKIFALIDFP